MSNGFRSLDRISIPNPCAADWESMVGNDHVRFCEHCHLHVTDLSSMTRQDAIRFVAQSRGRVCIRYLERPGGGLLSRKMPEPLYRIGRRASRIAAGAFSATLSLSSVAAQVRPANSGAQSRETVELIETTGLVKPTFDEFSASVSGTITRSEGGPIADATVVLVDRDTGEERYATSSNSGEYVFQLLPAADYLLWVRKPGFETERNTVAVRPNSGARIDITLIDKAAQISVMGGAMALIEVENENPLVKAVSDNDLAAVETLAFAESNINAIKPLNGSSLLNQAVEHGNREMVKVLILAGADVNMRSADGRTALMSLSDKNSAGMVCDLIDAGAKVNARDDNGDSSLMIAAGSAGPAVLKELLRAGARVDATNSSGETALFAAARSNSVEALELLIEAGASVNAEDEDGQTPLMAMLVDGDVERFKALVERGAKIDLADNDGRTTLMLAALNDEPGIVELLLERGLNVDAKAHDGSTALMLAAESGPVKTVSLLIYAGATMDARDNEGRSALLRAAFYGSVESVEALLAAGADFTARDNEGKTALALAREVENDDVVTLLKDRGAPE